MTCRIYLGEYQDAVTGTAAIAYVAIDEQGRLIQADARTVKKYSGNIIASGQNGCAGTLLPARI